MAHQRGQHPAALQSRCGAVSACPQSSVLQPTAATGIQHAAGSELPLTWTPCVTSRDPNSRIWNSAETRRALLRMRGTSCHTRPAMARSCWVWAAAKLRSPVSGWTGREGKGRGRDCCACLASVRDRWVQKNHGRADPLPQEDGAGAQVSAKGPLERATARRAGNLADQPSVV